jgi:hypothetical protein
MSRLLKNSPQYRDPLLAKNEFTNNDEYVVGHPNALSDGDEHGKGETDTIGSATDIKKRQQLEAKNKYTLNDPYDSSNA